MAPQAGLGFGPFRLAGRDGPLTRDGVVVKLRSKALALLWTLVRQPGDVVSKVVLFDALWPRAVAADSALAFQVNELRRALGDDAKSPRYVATVHRVGFRFVAEVLATGPADPAVHAARVPEIPIVGRDAQLQQLWALYARALAGQRQVVFVTGEAGIGKTRLIDSFVLRAKSLRADLSLGRGQCVEQHGKGEAFLPVLDALGRLCRQADGAFAVKVLRRLAPNWLVQIAGLSSAAEQALLAPPGVEISRERMLREMADALEALSEERPLVLVLEDLHWADSSTVELLALIARRTQNARLMLLCSYRPEDLALSGHPLRTLKSELMHARLAAQTPLGGLGSEDVHAYLRARFRDDASDPALAVFVHQRTDGQPLLMVHIADYLAAQGQPVSALSAELRAGVPESLRELVDAQLHALDETGRGLLETASVEGNEFTVACIAGVNRELSIDAAEDFCERIARQGRLLTARGLAIWPDGTMSGRYAFRHALQAEALRSRIGEARRARLHRRVAELKLLAYGDRAAEIAAELAEHFERGRDPSRAAHHHHVAGEKALRRSANSEAIVHFTKGLELLAALPAKPERAGRELRLQVALSLALTMTAGYSSPQLEQVNARAYELCQQLEDHQLGGRQLEEWAEISSALFRIERFYLVRGEIRTARELGERLLRIAGHVGDPSLVSRAHTALAFESFSLGDFTAAQAHAEQSIAFHARETFETRAAASADDVVEVSLSVSAFALQMLGYPDQAQVSLRKAVEGVRQRSIPFQLGGALLSTADLHLLRRESAAVRDAAEALMALATREDFPYYLSRAKVLRGWALAEQGEAEAGIAEIHQGLADFEVQGALLWKPCCLGLLAEAYGKAGKVEEALAVLAEALEIGRKTGEREYEAELHRVEAELLLEKRQGTPQSTARRQLLASAEECLHRAITIARLQQAKSLELRAGVSLARVWQLQDKSEAAHRMVAETFRWFTEGFDTKDLAAAKALLSDSTAERSGVADAGRG